MKVSRGVREAFVIAARAPRRVRPGQRIRVRLLLQRRRGGRFRLSFPMRVPRSLRPGARVLTLRGVVPASLQEASEDGIEIVLEDLAGGGAGSGDDAGPRSVGELAARHRRARRARRPARDVRLARPRAGRAAPAAACCCAASSQLPRAGRRRR